MLCQHESAVDVVYVGSSLTVIHCYARKGGAEGCARLTVPIIRVLHGGRDFIGNFNVNNAHF
jgi:hypothetical protein